MQKFIVLRFFYFGFSCLLLSVLPTAYSQSFETEQLLRFADSLFQEGDYLNAAHEYRRYLFLHPDADNRDLVQFSLAAAYQNAGKLREAIETYQKLINTYPQSSLIPKTQSNIAQCQLLQGDKSTAIASLQQFQSDYPKGDLAPRAQFTIAMIHMENKEWEAASRAWQQVSIKYPQTPFAEMSSRLAHTVQHGTSLPRRSLAIAGLFSAVIPGLGQTYSGRFSDGLQSLIVVGGLAAGTAYYIDQEQYEVAIPVGIVGLFFYAGNIFGSVQLAKIFNRQQEDNFLDGLRGQIQTSNFFGALSPRSTDVPLVRWQSRF